MLYYFVQVDTIYSRGYDVVYYCACAYNKLQFIHTADSKRQQSR